MIKAVIFDFDDTLVKSVEIKWKVIKETGKFYSLKITNDDIENVWGLPFEDMLTGAMQNVDSFNNLQKKYFEVLQKYPMEAYPDAIDTINKLIEEKYKVGILTASNRSMVLYELKKLKFPIINFAFIQTAEDTKFHKPDPKVFLPAIKILRELNISREEILYVGDSTRDFLAARDSGLDFCGILHGTSTKKEFVELGAITIENLSELFKYT